MDHSELTKEETETVSDEIETDETEAGAESEELRGPEDEDGEAEAAADIEESASDEIGSEDSSDAESGDESEEDDPRQSASIPLDDPAQQLRMVEALLFAAAEPLDRDSIAARLPEGADVGALIEDLQTLYENRGVNLVRVANKWMFRTAEDLSFLMRREAKQQKRLSRAALETLAIIAYHQPVTRAEIEEIRGVSVSKGTVDVLMETGWVRLRGRRRVPGRPVTYGTSDAFLVHFGLENISDLPGLEELKAAGLLEGRLPPDFMVPVPSESGGDGDGEFDDDPLHEEYGEALDDHVEQSARADEGEGDD
ncbi:SMC-Scp complex subunit ScpB [Tepidicaulis sp. LMO-SS28]|uniref:SMC-Scp complex subunit ScpB n=1 Tax=Tepidicaulis sp. LMO-SS28 TaxID=3447455 RepID=UPI003EDFD32B